MQKRIAVDAWPYRTLSFQISFKSDILQAFVLALIHKCIRAYFFVYLSHCEIRGCAETQKMERQLLLFYRKDKLWIVANKRKGRPRR